MVWCLINLSGESGAAQIAHALRRVYGEDSSGHEHYGLVIDENFTYDAQRAQARAQSVRKASA